MPIIDSLDRQTVPEALQFAPATLSGSLATVASPYRRCTGHCCQGFSLQGLTWMDLQENLRRVQNGGPWPQKTERSRVHPYLSGEINGIAFIVENFMPLGLHTRTLRAPRRKLPHPTFYFTCKCLQSSSCIRYVDRPEVCRTYPDTGTCEYMACTAERPY